MAQALQVILVKSSVSTLPVRHQVSDTLFNSLYQVEYQEIHF